MEENVTHVEAQPINSQPATLKQHRGTLVLVLGILGLVCCFICGIIAWVLANKDIKEMDEGIMDPEGRGITQAGKICGIVSIALQAVGLLIWIGTMLLAIIGAAAANT